MIEESLLNNQPTTTMNNTPTPRTDAESFLSRGMGIVPTLPKEVVPIAFSRTLERELTAVTEQRDRLAEAIRKHKFCDVELYEALQSLNQNVNVEASAVKQPTNYENGK